MKKGNLPRIIFYLVLMLFAANFISIFFYKQIYNHGAAWFFRIYHYDVWVWDDPYFRFFTFILQTPAIMVSRFFDSAKLALFTYSLSYMVYPFVGLAAVSLMLRKTKCKNLIFPITLSLFICLAPTWAFANAIVGESIVIFWILYSYVIVKDIPSVIIMGILGFLLLISYEISIMFYPLTIYILWREKKLKTASLVIFLVFTGLQFYNLVFRILPDESTQLYGASILVGIKSPVFILSLGIISCLAFASSSLRIIRVISGVIFLLILSWSIFDSIGMTTKAIWEQSFGYRTLSIPIAFALLLVAYENLRKNRYEISKPILVYLILALLPSLIIDLRLSYDTYLLREKYLTLLEDHKGCYVLSVEEQNEIFPNSFIPQWDLPFVSMMFAKSNSINTVLFADFVEKDKNREKYFCRISVDNSRIEYVDSYQECKIYLDGRYKFDNVINSIKK